MKSYGEDSLRRLTDATAGKLPYFGSLAFKKVFRRSLGDLWDEFAASVYAAGLTELEAATRLTHHGYTVVGPRFGPDGRLYYSIANAHGFPALMAIEPGSSTPRKVANRYFGSGIGFAGPLVVVDRLEVVNQVGLQSDLYAIAAGNGDERRLTFEMRAADPDVSPDGRTIIVRSSSRSPGLRDRAYPRRSARSRMLTTLIPNPVSYASPRWSPSGL